MNPKHHRAERNVICRARTSHSDRSWEIVKKVGTQFDKG